MRVAVVGHVEFVEFLVVDRAPAPGAILRATSTWEEPAGGGAVAAVELARLVGRSTFFTAHGDDARGRSLAGWMQNHGVELVADEVPGPHRRGFSMLDPNHERTIVVFGESQAPVDLDPARLRGFDAVYFCKGDAASLRAAREARVLVATARALSIVQEAGVRVDALVASANDPAEVYVDGDLRIAPGVVVRTRGAQGGTWSGSDGEGTWKAGPLPGPALDAYGCGDCFAAGLTLAMARGLSLTDAIAFAASRGALALTRRGALGA